jgi:hypothetical protein
MQMPYYAENFSALEGACVKRGVAVQTIKAVALAPWKGREQTRSTWYEPLEAQADIDLAVWWALGNPNVFVNTVGDVDLLPRVLDAASRFESRPDDARMQELMRRVSQEPLFV